ncbi:MAG: hypothetical protein PWP37_1788 [Thermotogota bacterium]|nr:hypothetical protein [Thermotogota bacterium]MDK2865596.1 hypothetical protein [Thermotogota bacterium]
MKKLIVVLLAVALGSLAMAAPVSIDVNSGDGAAYFEVTIGSNGIDIGSGFSDGPYWSYSVSVEGLSLSISGVGGTVSITSISGENDHFGFTYGTFAADPDNYGWSSYIFPGVSGEAFVSNFKDFGLELAYVDTVDPDATEQYFDDVVALKLADFDLGLGTLGVAGAVYGGAQMGFGAEANLAVDLLSVTVGFGNDGANTGYAAYAKYGALEVGPLSVTAWVEYTDGLASLTYAAGADSQAVGATVELGLGPDVAQLLGLGPDVAQLLGLGPDVAQLTVTAKPAYDLVSQAFTTFLQVDLAGTVDPVEYDAGVVWDDVVAAATDVYVYASASLKLSLGLTALSDPTLSASFGYGYSATLDAGPGADKWSASVSLSSALYDLVDLSAAVNFAKDADVTWSVTLSKSVSF